MFNLSWLQGHLPTWQATTVHSNGVIALQPFHNGGMEAATQ